MYNTLWVARLWKIYLACESLIVINKVNNKVYKLSNKPQSVLLQMLMTLTFY